MTLFMGMPADRFVKAGGRRRTSRDERGWTMVERFDVRPWPIDPRTAPLNPSYRKTGPAYSPLICCEGAPQGFPYYGHAANCCACSVKLP